MVGLFALLGLILGALINLLADSLPRSRRPEMARCPSCGGPRPLAEWSALASLWLGRGQCAYCGAGRSYRSYVVEVMAAAGAAGWWLARPEPWPLATGLLAGFVFLLIGVIDLEHRLILHIVSVPAAVLLGSLRALDPNQGPVKTLIGGAVGFGILLMMYLLGLVFSRVVSARRGRPIDEVAFGFGDVMLGGVLGLTVGWPGIVVAVFLGILAAGVFSLGLVLVHLARGRYSAFLAIPYGPFLLLGAAIVLYGGREAFQAVLD